ncbi:glycosyl hydrolase family 18 protein [Bacillus sp. FJAT-28004]|uniref:glycosyl hydrolase family 18 protein n=1 Tax=Bacillus sp. FJAT-28004 TaxID=1679165 RepID=UPI0006B64BF9|nr:glycosyl hydrolase family 18 protein [Bacillus sp. FJAT-28004]
MKKKKMKAPTLVMLMAMLLSVVGLFVPAASTHAAAAQGAANNSYKIIGYYPSWGAYGRGYNVTDIDASKLTHINYAFADICWNGSHGNPDPTGPNSATWACQNEAGAINVPNGTIVLGDPWIDAQKAFAGDSWDKPLKGNIGQLIKLKQANPHLRTMISIGGWTWSNRFSDVAASSATRSVFAKSAVDFIRHYQFDGVDLDWEYPVSGGLAGNSARPEDKHNYTLLLQEVRKELDTAEIVDGKTYELTIASGASPSYANNTELAQIAATVDWINIMTYDFNGGWSTKSAHNAPLYTDSAAVQAGIPNADTFNVAKGVQGHLDAGVPANKLVLGVPFYGRGWSGCAAGPNGDGQYQACASTPPAGTWEAGVFDYGDLAAQYINKNGFVRYWNDVAKVPYLYNAASKVFISYDDYESFGYKIDYLKTKGLAGGMFWELSSDCRVSGNYSCSGNKLLDKLAGDLNNGGTPGGGNPTDPADTTAPSTPANFTSNAKTASSVTLSWSASTDNKGVTGYQVYNGTALATTVAGTTATISELNAETTYSFTIKAKDAAGNLSAASAALSVTTEAAPSGTCPAVEWAAATAYSGGQQVKYNGTVYEAKWWTQGDRPDQSGAWGVWKVIGPCGSGGGGTTSPEPVDTTAPSAPAGLTVTGQTSSTVSLSWSASLDNTDVTGYEVFNGSTIIAQSITASVVISGLTAGTTYNFTVKAKDAAGNRSAASSQVSVTLAASSGGGNGTGAAAWSAGVSYNTGDLVSYNGVTYKCLQPHKAIVGWEPANVLSLWQAQA